MVEAAASKSYVKTSPYYILQGKNQQTQHFIPPNGDPVDLP